MYKIQKPQKPEKPDILHIVRTVVKEMRDSFKKNGFKDESDFIFDIAMFPLLYFDTTARCEHLKPSAIGQSDEPPLTKLNYVRMLSEFVVKYTVENDRIRAIIKSAIEKME